MVAGRFVKAALARVLPESVYMSLVARNAAWSIATRRRWAPEITFLPLYVKPGDTAVDIGGNQGLYTYHLSRLVGASGTVHAFEPLPPNVEVLRDTVRVHRLQNVLIHPVACGSAAGRAEFSIPSFSGIPHFAHARQGGPGQKFRCDIVKLDDVVQAKISFLKVDVEGAELFVLQGADRILRESRPTVLFEAGEHTSDMGYQQEEVFDFLRRHGYRFYNGGVDGSTLQPRERFTERKDYFAVAE